VIDMHVPPGGGVPHRHDLEGTFILMEGKVEATFHVKKSVVRAGDSLNISSNAPHHFHNASSKQARLLCICSPAGQENFFMDRNTGRHPHDATLSSTRSSRPNS
jgi:quercetin dioxygenase-like cupin family protein